MNVTLEHPFITLEHPLHCHSERSEESYKSRARKYVNTAMVAHYPGKMLRRATALLKHDTSNGTLSSRMILQTGKILLRTCVLIQDANINGAC